MTFKSYSWSIGTTSFRTSQLNYKIERQLQLLKEFWKLNPNLPWNPNTQEKYYNFLKENNFIYGEAPRPDKDAREKTSGYSFINASYFGTTLSTCVCCSINSLTIILYGSSVWRHGISRYNSRPFCQTNSLNSSLFIEYPSHYRYYYKL